MHIVILHQFLIFQRGTPPAEACEKENNQPHIVLFFDEEEDSILQQYFVCVEQELMMESSNIVAAIFFCVAAHYIFNLSYHRKTGDVWLFIQEKILFCPQRMESGVTHLAYPTSVEYQGSSIPLQVQLQMKLRTEYYLIAAGTFSLIVNKYCPSNVSLQRLVLCLLGLYRPCITMSYFQV